MPVLNDIVPGPSETDQNVKSLVSYRKTEETRQVLAPYRARETGKAQMAVDIVQRVESTFSAIWRSDGTSEQILRKICVRTAGHEQQDQNQTSSKGPELDELDPQITPDYVREWLAQNDNTDLNCQQENVPGPSGIRNNIQSDQGAVIITTKSETSTRFLRPEEVIAAEFELSRTISEQFHGKSQHQTTEMDHDIQKLLDLPPAMFVSPTHASLFDMKQEADLNTAPNLPLDPQHPPNEVCADDDKKETEDRANDDKKEPEDCAGDDTKEPEDGKKEPEDCPSDGTKELEDCEYEIPRNEELTPRVVTRLGFLQWVLDKSAALPQGDYPYPKIGGQLSWGDTTSSTPSSSLFGSNASMATYSADPSRLHYR